MQEFERRNFEYLCKVNLDIRHYGATPYNIMRVAYAELSLGNFNQSEYHCIEVLKCWPEDTYHCEEAGYLLEVISNERKLIKSIKGIGG